MAAETWVKDGGTWREVDPAGAYAKDGGSWREIAEGWIKEGGVWRKVFQKSDPQTFQHNPTDTASFRPQGWRSQNDGLYQDSFGFGDHIGAMAFDYDTIQAQLATRPNVVSARLWIKREQSNHGFVHGVNLHVASLKPGEVGAGPSYALVKSGQPDLVDGSIEDTGVEFSRGDSQWATIDNAHIERLRDDVARGLALAVSESLANPGDESTEYGIFHGIYLQDGETTPPILEFTCDF